MLKMNILRIESISLKITRIYFKFLLRPGGRNLRRNYSTVVKVLGMSCWSQIFLSLTSNLVESIKRFSDDDAFLPQKLKKKVWNDSEVQN